MRTGQVGDWGKVEGEEKRKAGEMWREKRTGKVREIFREKRTGKVGDGRNVKGKENMKGSELGKVEGDENRLVYLSYGGRGLVKHFMSAPFMGNATTKKTYK